MAPDEQLRRRLLGWGLAGVLAPQAVLAQDDRPIEWVVGYAAGGGSDAVARVVAESMSRSLQRRIVVMVDTASALPYVTSGRLRAIAIASAARHPLLPEVATLAEQGLKDFEAYARQGLVVPVQTPPATTEAFHRALLQALGSESVLVRLQALGVEPLAGTPAAMSAYVRSERERWGRLIRDNHIKLD